MRVKELRPSDRNPRTISTGRLESLKRSLQQDRDFLELPERNAEDEQLALEAASNATASASLYGRYREPVFRYLRARFAPSKSTRRSVKTSG